MADVTSFRACGGARDLVETCINDLRMLSKTVQHGEQVEELTYCRGRRTAVIILYATGEVGVTEGWSLNGGDFSNPTLLAAPEAP